MKIDKKKAVAVLRHYVYAALSAGIAAYLAGTTDAKAVATAALVGVLGPILGALDPKNTRYGVGSKKAAESV